LRSHHRWWVPSLGAVAVMAAAVIAVPVSAAHADPLGSPTDVAASFTGWSGGQSNLSVTWTPVAGADGYEITDAPGDSAPTSPGIDIAVPGGSSTASPLTVDWGGSDVSVAVFAYAGQPGNVTALSAPGTVTFAVPGAPTLTATPVSGVRGHATLSWSVPTTPGDTLVLREGTDSAQGPTTGTSITIPAQQDSVEVSGLPDNPAYTYFSLYELDGGQPADWSPASLTLAYAAPEPEGQLVSIGQDDYTPSFSVSWLWPQNCPNLNTNCDEAVVVENPGSKVAANPSDGIVETAPGAAWGRVVITDATAGDTYTFTVFNTATIHGVLTWSTPESETFDDLVMSNIEMGTSAPGPFTAGTPVTITATVSTTGTTPTGTVHFFTWHQDLCDNVTVVDETATCQTNSDLIGDEPSSEPPSGFDVWADYSGDGQDSFEEGVFIVVAVHKADPSLTMDTKPASKKRVTLTARVHGRAGNGTGTVSIASGKHKLCAHAQLRRGVATCSILRSRIGVGRHTVAITYSGSMLYLKKSHKAVVRISK
jgi:hypothetical protein